MIEILKLWIALFFSKAERKSETGSSANPIAEPGSAVAPVPGLYEEAPFQLPAEKRARLAQQRTMQINRLLAEHNVALSNYTTELFSRIHTGEVKKETEIFTLSTPGGQLIGERSQMGNVICALLDGTFVPNTSLGER